MAKRRNFTDQFKAKVALEALRGDTIMQEIAAKHQLHPTQAITRVRQATDGWPTFSQAASRGGR
jgi:transposase